jgi:amino acid adenylation domain-containing protein/thioester reductase-like protein
VRKAPLIEVELDCEVGSPLDYRRACGLEQSAVCTGALVELLLVSARELGADPVAIQDLVLSGHAPIGDGMRLLARAYEGSLEVVGGSLNGAQHWNSTHAFAAVHSEIGVPAARVYGSETNVVDPCALEQLQARAGGSAVGAWIREARRDEARGCLRIEVDATQLPDLAAYALHPLLWEAGVVAAEIVLGGHRVADLQQHPADAPRALAVASVGVYELGAAPASIEATRAGDCAAISWRGDDGRLIAEVSGLRVAAELVDAPVQRRSARVVEHTLGKRVHDVHQPLAELGVSSIDRARVASALALDFGCKPELEAILACESLAQIAQLFARAAVDEGASALEPLAALDPNARYVLSAAQRQVWALAAMAPDTPRCHVHMRLRIRGQLDPSAMRRALHALIERHASLRVVIDSSGDQPLQRVLDQPLLELHDGSLRSSPAEEREAKLIELSDHYARMRFDLERGPLIRFGLVSLDEREHALLIVAHHLIVDGFGLERMIRELLALYESSDAFGGERVPLSRIAERYLGRDEERRAAGSGVQPARDAARRLPLARDVDGTAPGHGGRAAIELPEGLRKLAQVEQVSLFSLVCAAYGYVLARHAGQDEVVIGVVSAARRTLDELSAVGMFARSVPLRLAIEQERSLLALARDIHGRVPQLVRQECDGADATPFAATALFQSWDRAPFTVGELELQLELDSPDGAPAGYSRSELELLAADYGDELTACLQYDRSVLREVTAGWLARATSLLLRRACEAPERALGETLLVSRSDALVLEGIALSIDEPCVHRRIAAQARRTPDATAVRDGSGTQLSFGMLAQRAQLVARALRARGARAGRFIGIVAERVADLPVAVLAVLESGAAYVPIDPSHPQERVQLALEDAQVELVIGLGLTPRAFTNAQVLDIEALLLEGSVAPMTATWQAPRANDAAYVLHTSGSTGKPKGVIVEHASLSSFVSAMEALLPKDATKPWLALTTLAFDISIVELVFSLAIGAETRVGVAPSLRSGEAEPFALLRTLGRDAGCFQCTPSLARLLLEDRDGRAFLQGLSVLLVGGESLPTWLARALCELVPGSVFNVYGPTETTVWSSAARLSRDDGWVPIGGPLANTTLCVVDEAGHDVPAGLSGELWIGGAGVARGYLNRAEETASRFVTRDTGDGPRRFYRTGDLVRVRARESELAFEWLGRMDRQIKLAGNRIELGEIEGVLTEHPFARECAVLTERVGGEERLLAAIVPDIANAVDALTGEDALTGIFSQDQLEGALSAWAEQRLPPYMIPARMLFLDSLPRTGSGKTDRQALARLAERSQTPPLPPLAEHPVTREEKLLARLWSEVLARPEIGRYDDFFALGGTSFAAVLLASRARKSGIALAPATVLAYPTLAEQALQISAAVVQREALALQDELQLDVLPKSSGEAAWPPKRVVLTGATGFLGAHLLVELQAALEAEIVCLIRARDDFAARARLEQSLASWGLGARVQWGLTRCVAADITRPHFGLSDEDWRFLTQHADLVLHNAAEVNFALSYDELRVTNVGGTRTAIELAAQGKQKPLHYVSTIAITDAAEQNERVDEETPLTRSDQLTDGYSQSKWVAEGIVRLAAQQGLRVTCYRAGPLILDRAPKGDAFAEALATVARTGVSFSTRGRAIPHLSRVDDTARAIVMLALDRTRRGQIEHVVSPQLLPVADLVAWIREWGFEVTELSDAEWLARVDADAWASATMFVVSQRLRDGIPLVPEVEHGATLVRLSALGFTWRDIDGVLIQRLLAKLTGAARATEAEAG